MPTSNLRFTRDEQGHATVLGPTPDDALAAFLREELPPGSPAARRLLEVVGQVRSGLQPGCEVPGDCWSVELTPVRATLHTEHVIPGRSLRLTVEELEAAVRSWAEFLEGPWANRAGE